MLMQPNTSRMPTATHSISGHDLAAVAWCGNGVLVIEFHEVLVTSEGEYFTFARELRVTPTPDEYPDSMPEEALLDALRRWASADFPLLPVVVADAPRTSVVDLQTSSLRGLPVGAMRAHLWAAVDVTEADSFEIPTAAEVAALLDSGVFFAFGTKAKAAAHLAQLQAAGAYVAALAQGNTVPLSAVMAALDVDRVRARNLIQFARTNGYLGGGSQGRASGFLTRKAEELAGSARQALSQIEGTNP